MTVLRQVHIQGVGQQEGNDFGTGDEEERRRPGQQCQELGHQLLGGCADSACQDV